MLIIWCSIPPVLNHCTFDFIRAFWNYHTGTLCIKVKRYYRRPIQINCKANLIFKLPSNRTTRKFMKHINCTAVCYCSIYFVFSYSSFIGVTAPDSDNHWLTFTLGNTPRRSLFCSRLLRFNRITCSSICESSYK